LGSRVPSWASSNAAVATVSSDGRVTGVSVGSANIVATVDGKSANAAITVDPAAPEPVATVAVSLSAQNVNVGQTAQATAVLRDASGAVLTGRSVTWSSAAPQLASVSSSGLVTTIAAGSASIVATSEGQSGSATLVIGSTAPAPVATVTLSVTSTSMFVGQTQTIGVTLKDAQGNTLSGRTIAWSSSSLSVLTVSPSGTVTAVGSGTSTVTATSEGKSGSVTITTSPASVFPVTNVTVAAPTTSLAVGQTTQATFTAKDHNGTLVTGKTATWSSSAPSVASVSSAGIITGVAGGQAVINATVDGIVGSLPVTVLAPGGTLTTVVVTLGNSSLSVGQTTQATASGRDANGALVAMGTPTWTSSNTAIATVSSTGVVSAVANGSASITATVSGKSGTASLSVATTSSGAAAAPPELPRALPAVSFAKATRTVQVTSNLQAALDAAQPGDSLVLSGTFTGNFVLPTRSCGAGITITSAAALPAPGTRVTPATAASFAKIITPNSAAALKTSNPNCGWRLVGVEIGASASAGVVGVSLNYGIFWLGDGGWTGGGETQTSLAQVPQQIVLDRVYIHGTSTTNSTRCLYLNSGNTIIRDSYLADCHANGADSQAILGCNGPGPYLIENNYLEGAGENVMFGGCDPVSSDLIPSDITIRRNHIRKPLTWMGGPWSIKNLFELKDARRVLLEDNVLENSWVASQMGMAIVLKSSTETCSACSWEGTKDVTVRYNVFRNAHRGLNLQAVDASSAGYTASHTERIAVYHNLFTGIGTVNGKVPSDGWLMLMVGDLKDVSISHNTFIGNTPNYGLALMMSAPGAQRFDVLDNMMAGQSYYGVSGDLGAVHTAALNWYAGTAWRFTGNVLAQVDQSFWSLNPGGNQYYTAISQLGLRSDGSSSLSTSAGADIPTLLSRTQGVQSP
jgi:uncharacterized protein YjdB